MSEPVGSLVEPCEKLLFRQIHPEKFTKGKPGTANFLPVPGKSNFVPEDGVNLSTRREEIGAKGSHEAHIELGSASAGTWAFSVNDAAKAHTPGLPVFDDEGMGNPPLPPFHMTVRFPENLTRGRQERIAKQLYAAAQQRGDNGWLYRP